MNTLELIEDLANALGLCAAIVDSFLNGQGAATVEEMDAALMAAREALQRVRE